MKSTTIHREKFGLSQPMLALYLGVSRSLLNMFETGQRLLPTPAYARMAKMELFFHHQDKTKMELPPTQEKEQREQVQKHLVKMEEEIEFQRHKAQHKLDKMKASYQKTIDLLHFAAQVAAENKAPDKATTLWLELMEIKTDRGMEKYGLQEQFKLEFAIKTAEVQLKNIGDLKKNG